MKKSVCIAISALAALSACAPQKPEDQTTVNAAYEAARAAKEQAAIAADEARKAREDAARAAADAKAASERADRIFRQGQDK